MKSFISMLVMVVIVFSNCVSLYVVKQKYKQGQIDALTGKVKYELVTNFDSTRLWMEIDDK